MPKTYTYDTLPSATKPTFYFIGVTTGSSSIRRVFPLWAKELGLGDVEMVGIDLALDATREQYRHVVKFIRDDELSLGALVTTHKLNIYREAHGLFEKVDPLAQLMGEVSCISKQGGVFNASAKDPISSGFALDAFIPSGYFEETGADLFIMGAGGSAIAIEWYLSQPSRGADRPGQAFISDLSESRLAHLQEIHAAAGHGVALNPVVLLQDGDNDRVLEQLAPGSVVINATGLGKDAPGSPLTDAATFPERARVWELNYRGDLVFLDQARAQEEPRRLHVEDGWVYFLHGWTQVISDVFDIEIPPSGPSFERLSDIAKGAR